MPGEHDLLADELIRAVELLADTFASSSIRYAVVGGLATMLRGRPRFTQDVDVLLDVPQFVLPGLLEELVCLGFVLDIATVIREYVQEHMTAFRFGSVRIDRREWSAVAAGEEARTAWLEGAITRLVPPRPSH